MKANPPEQRKRRIAVILGSSGSNRHLLDQLLPLLGTDRDIEMQGVFLEEAEVQHAAELPFVQELCRVTFSVREFNSEHFEHALNLRMRTARRALAVLAKRTGVAHSFRNVRSSAITLVRETASASDITVFEPTRLVASATGQSIHLPDRRRIVAVIDNPTTADISLLTASRLADGEPERVVLILSSRLAEDREILDRWLLRFLPGRPLMRIVSGDTAELIEAARLEPASMLVLGVGKDTLDQGVLRRLRDRQRCPICLVRRWGEAAGGE